MCLEVGALDDGFRGVGVAGALVCGGELRAVAECELVEDGRGDGLVDGQEDGAEGGGGQFAGFESDRKDLNFLDAVAGREVDGFWGEFVCPDDFGDLAGEAFADGAGGFGKFVDFAFGEGAVEFGLFGEVKHLGGVWASAEYTSRGVLAGSGGARGQTRR